MRFLTAVRCGAISCLLAACQSAPPQEATVPYRGRQVAFKAVHEAQATLGEGPIWHGPTNTLFWVDIEAGRLHAYRAASGDHEAWELGSRVGTVVPTPDGQGAVVALETGLHCLHLPSGGLSLLADPVHAPGDIRYNDGKCAPDGRLWVGSMALDQRPHAAKLYCVQPDGRAEAMLDSVTISNGLAWTAAGDTLYYIDTPTQQVKAFPYAEGRIGPARVAVQVPDSLGYPDGMAIDAEGMLWIGMWGGWSVTRWDPRTGTLLDRIALPVPNVTACAFGGPNLETMYITTARAGMSEEELAQSPLSGALLSLRPGVAGQATHPFPGCPPAGTKGG
jgi:sugar lactone lactonase YvrE